MYSEKLTSTSQYVELRKRIFDKSTIGSMDRNQRFVAAMYAISKGDQRPFLYFSEEERVDFLLKSDVKFKQTAADLGITVQDK